MLQTHSGKIKLNGLLNKGDSSFCIDAELLTQLEAKNCYFLEINIASSCVI